MQRLQLFLESNVSMSEPGSCQYYIMLAWSAHLFTQRERQPANTVTQTYTHWNGSRVGPTEDALMHNLGLVNDWQHRITELAFTG